MTSIEYISLPFSQLSIKLEQTQSAKILKPSMETFKLDSASNFLTSKNCNIRINKIFLVN